MSPVSVLHGNAVLKFSICLTGLGKGLPDTEDQEGLVNVRKRVSSKGRL